MRLPHSGATIYLCYALVVASLLLGAPALHSLQASSGPSDLPTNTVAPPSAGSGAGAVSAKKFLSDFEFWLSAEILVFGFGVIAIEYLLLRKARVTAEEALRVYAVTLIIVGTLFAITAGFDATQVAPAMGLFGTIAGYLLGKRAMPATSTKTEEKEE